VCQKTTGVLNFAHGAIGMFAAFVAYQFDQQLRWPTVRAVLLALAFAAAFGWFIQRSVLRTLRERLVLTRVIVTLRWLLVLQSVASLIWQDTSYHQSMKMFPSNGVTIAGLSIGYNQLANVIVAAVLAVLLALFLRLTLLGTPCARPRRTLRPRNCWASR
jgi:branched-subunit amino acid ABC-type transport system permease component